MIEHNFMYFHEILLYHIPPCTVKCTGYSKFPFKLQCQDIPLLCSVIVNTLNATRHLSGMELCNPECHAYLSWLNNRNSPIKQALDVYSALF